MPDLLTQGIAVETEQLCRLYLVATGRFQALGDQWPLNLPKDAVVKAIGWKAITMRLEVGAQMTSDGI